MLRVNESQNTGQPRLWGGSPIQPLPRLENRTVLGEPEITPFAAERQGGGAGAKAGRQAVALRGPRSQALGVSRLLSLGAWLLVWCGRDPRYPP